VKYHDGTHQDQGEIQENRQEIGSILSLHFSERTACAARQTLENRRIPRESKRAEGDFTPNMG
jgi:hypothetical protein